MVYTSTSVTKNGDYSMADYKKLIPIIKRWEGGFANHPNDPGGATNSGITLTTFRSVYGKSKTVQDLKNMTNEQWEYIFKTRFWDRWKADDIDNQAIANLLVDWLWASGIYGIKYPQSVLGVKVDGLVGLKTLAAINYNPNKRDLFNKFWQRRKKHFDDIVRNRPASKVFYKGWMNRLNDFKWFE